jgi:hypothetical protein
VKHGVLQLGGGYIDLRLSPSVAVVEYKYRFKLCIWQNTTVQWFFCNMCNNMPAYTSPSMPKRSTPRSMMRKPMQNVSIDQGCHAPRGSLAYEPSPLVCAWALVANVLLFVFVFIFITPPFSFQVIATNAET